MEKQIGNMRLRAFLLGLSAALLLFSLTALAVIGFGSGSRAEAAEEEQSPISGVSLALHEDIALKIHTRNVDGDYLVIDFNGERTELTEAEEGVFVYDGITPQYMTETITAALYDASGTQIDNMTMTVREYLMQLLSADYDESKYGSPIKYDAMRELCADLLQYGAAAQLYTGTNTGALATDGADMSFATGTVDPGETDRSVTDEDEEDGYYWIGAGVRFDYKIGLYFLFNAEETEGLVLQVDGETVSFFPYGSEENRYIAYYNGFTAVDMNRRIEAVLYDGAGERLCSCIYSVRSYVVNKQDGGDALAALAQAAYAYGYAAVAYANAAYTAPTLESAGSIGLSSDGGYDYSGSEYETVILPALNPNDYDACTVLHAETGTGLATTTFTYAADERYAYSVEADDAFELNGVYYTEYDLENLVWENAVVTRDENGYTIAASGAVAENIAVYGDMDLTVTGQLSLSADGVQKDAVNVRSGALLLQDAQVSVVATQETAQSGVNSVGLTIDEDSSLTVDGFDYAVYMNGNVSVYGSVTFRNLATAGFGSWGDADVLFDGATLDASECTVPVVYRAGDAGNVTLTILGDMTLNAQFITSAAVNIGNAERSGNLSISLSGADAVVLNGGSLTVVNGTLSVEQTTETESDYTGVNLNINGVSLTVGENGSMTATGFGYAVGSWTENTSVTVNGSMTANGIVYLANGTFTVNGENANVTVNGTMTIGGDASVNRLAVVNGSLTVNAAGTQKGVVSASVQVGAADGSTAGYLNISTESQDGLVLEGSGAPTGRYNFYKGAVTITNTGTVGATGMNFSSATSDSELWLCNDCNLTVTGFDYWVGTWGSSWVQLHKADGYTGTVAVDGEATGCGWNNWND